MTRRYWRSLDGEARAGALGGVAVVVLFHVVYLASFPETLADPAEVAAAPIGLFVAVAVPGAWPQPLVLLAPGLLGGAGAAARVRLAGDRPGWRTLVALSASSWGLFAALAVVAPVALVLVGPPLRPGELGIALLLELVLLTVLLTALVTAVVLTAGASVLLVRHATPARDRP